MTKRLRRLGDTLAWNLFLLTFGALVFVVGYNGIAAHHQFIPAALYGFAALVAKVQPGLSLAWWYVLLNLPIFLLAWRGVSRRFFLLNLYCMGVTALLTAHLRLDLGLREPMHAAIAAGALMGAGAGIILRSYGAGGGLDVLAVALNQRLGLRIGVFYFAVNGLLMLAMARFMPPDMVVSTLILVFISSVVTEYVLSLFNQRKVVMVLSTRTREIAQRATEKGLHATLIQGLGAYRGQGMEILYAVTDNLRLKTLEGLVFDTDPDATFIVEKTFSVIGNNFTRRRVY